ncbi:DUF2971 domain-containing protein [Chryseobacterium sp.]|uniref:DUF2971 domain-containing protein n=1 Tax=Chryseobacterium sp. TaxID=1871047 RepID=UPI0024E239CC|nr:DUF2971 domain-containing protein [Chryseobacterium sp.]
MKVYKYRSNYQRDILSLSLNQLFAPTYNNLNDPFEGMFNDKEDKKILELLKRFDTDSLEKAYEELVTMVKKKGIYSLCKTYDNEILWALYSDSHQGFVIEYDLDILLNDFNFNQLTPFVHTVEVKYKDSPQKSMIIIDSFNKRMDLANIIATKSLSWKHENEIRLIFEEPGINTFNFKAVTSIIFGLRASDKDINNVMNLLKGRGLKYYKMTTYTDSYKLKITDLQDQFIHTSEYIQNKAPFDENLLSDENIFAEYQIYKDYLKEIVTYVSSLPNIIKIDSIEIYGEIDKPKINILTTTSLKLLPVRLFQYQYIDKVFVQTN